MSQKVRELFCEFLSRKKLLEVCAQSHSCLSYSRFSVFSLGLRQSRQPASEMVGEVRAEGARFANPFRERFRCTEPRFLVFRIDLSMLWCGAGGSWGFLAELQPFRCGFTGT